MEEGAGGGPSNSPADADDQRHGPRHPPLLPTQVRGVDLRRGDGRTVTRLLVHDDADLFYVQGEHNSELRVKQPLSESSVGILAASSHPATLARNCESMADSVPAATSPPPPLHPSASRRCASQLHPPYAGCALSPSPSLLAKAR
ncbi:hypothetical protein CVT26_001550 [Gymnopilus dilepis]|uniref:Uncharacterized protein n=1 Tax=Gymnopilus dilepis TaxID=231916 RepID=A0A409X561_9AGAR|nr:hypothetical protein CVT26_001550 [Gymnopilus dilepis]